MVLNFLRITKFNKQLYRYLSTPVKRYNTLLNDGVLKPDKAQFLAILKLQELFNELVNYSPTLASSSSSSHSSGNQQTPALQQQHSFTQKGLYLHGGVGTGKTLLLDVFYDAIPTTAKKRVHFNTFMLYLYSELNRWCLNTDDSSLDDNEFVTPTEHIANKIIEDAWLLCLDEVQVSDYASYTLLEGVLRHMIQKGAVIVGTSNRAPQDLGDSSMSGDNDEIEVRTPTSFQSLFMNHCNIQHVDSEHDHREEMKLGQQRYLYPSSAENEEKLDQMFGSLLPSGQKISSSFLEIYNRKILIPLSVGGIARFTFHELCRQPLGPADYNLICSTYHTVFIDNIPKLNINQKNEARRLLTFIDAAYECRVKVYCTAETSCKDLFLMLPRDDNKYDAEQMHLEMIGEIAYDLKLAGLDFTSLNIISGEDEIFSFKRAISRFVEMQSVFYQNTEHRPHFFQPYLGTEEEKEGAAKKRVLREQRRIQMANETQEPVIVYHETVTNDNRKTSAWERQKHAPKFNEQHFWGFGWWEKLKDKFSNDKKDS